MPVTWVSGSPMIFLVMIIFKVSVWFYFTLVILFVVDSLLGKQSVIFSDVSFCDQQVSFYFK